MRWGTVTFQANEQEDIFCVAEVFENGVEPSDEALLNIEDPQFDSDKAWVTGKVPKIKPVSIEGDTTILHAWFKGETFDGAFVIRIYVEYELAEELQKVDLEKVEGEDTKADLEPQEIHL
ncbi:MAG: hypothetical protein WEB30_07060 [Cyclobacteriaceae bacterium]